MGSANVVAPPSFLLRCLGPSLYGGVAATEVWWLYMRLVEDGDGFMQRLGLEVFL